MRDIWGVLLLMISFIGALKGRNLPYILPYASGTVTILLFFYRGVIQKSKFAYLYTTALWVSLTWIAGKAMEQSWGSGIVSWVPLGFALMLTPAIGIVHQRIYRRFNPTPIRGLELEPSGNRQSLKSMTIWPFGKKQSQSQLQQIELITFDLGEEVQFKNR